MKKKLQKKNMKYDSGWKMSMNGNENTKYKTRKHINTHTYTQTMELTKQGKDLNYGR